MAEHRIRAGQVYESCRPTFVVDGVEVRTLIKVIDPPPGTPGLYRYGKAMVVTLTDDHREIRLRAMEVTQLHPTGTTRTGQPRKTGYRLIQAVKSPSAQEAQRG